MKYGVLACTAVRLLFMKTNGVLRDIPHTYKATRETQTDLRHYFHGGARYQGYSAARPLLMVMLCRCLEVTG